MKLNSYCVPATNLGLRAEWVTEEEVPAHLKLIWDDGRQRINKQTSAESDGLGWWEMWSKQDDYRSSLCLTSWHSVWLRVFEL